MRESKGRKGSVAAILVACSLALGTSVAVAADGTAAASSAAAGGATAPAAPPPEDAALLDAYGQLLGRLARALVAWIGQASGLETEAVNADPPDILFVAPGDTVRLGRDVLEIPPRMRGAYQTNSETILLVLPWNIADPIDQSVLLHELAHVVQLAAGGWRCDAETEWQAYELQQRWLAERGITIHLDWLAIGAASHCGPAAPESPLTDPDAEPALRDGLSCRVDGDLWSASTDASIFAVPFLPLRPRPDAPPSGSRSRR